MKLLLSTALLCFSLNAFGQCDEYIDERDGKMHYYPGIKSFVLEDRYQIGGETWFRGTFDRTAKILGSYKGNEFQFHIDGGEVKTAECSQYGILGEDFSII